MATATEQPKETKPKQRLSFNDVIDQITYVNDRIKDKFKDDEDKILQVEVIDRWNPNGVLLYWSLSFGDYVRMIKLTTRETIQWLRGLALGIDYLTNS